MYSDTITLFNRYEENGELLWYPTILRNVDLNVDKAAMIAKYGEQTADTAMLHIRYQPDGEKVYIGNKRYLPPKLWANQTGLELTGTLTFAGGTNFDFFIVGEWPDTEPVSDNSGEWIDGFYNYMNKRFDFVFSINSVAQYTILPHFEITAK